MIITVGRDHNIAKMCLTWTFSNENGTDNFTGLHNMQCIYIASGQVETQVNDDEPILMTSGNLYRTENWSNSFIKYKYDEHGASTFNIRSLDGTDIDCEIINGNKEKLIISEQDYQRWLIVVSGVIRANDKLLPTRAVVKIPENRQVVLFGELGILGLTEEIENCNYTIAIIKKRND
jgi:hypothetical protein